MTIEIEHKHEGWTARVTAGVWSSREPGLAAALQSITDADHGYHPDDEWTLALIAVEQVPGVTIVSERPEVTIDPGVVY
jgi:hypothetical protein